MASRLPVLLCRPRVGRHWYAGRSAVCRRRRAGEDIWRIALTQARPTILDAGLLTDEEFAEGLELFDHPGFLDMATALVSVWGRASAGT
ncbi:MAG: hypothetical protein M3Z25_11225 [Actinomycetota bacterium]|nr:hypothetical protein [Actinomycetota bacterium]